MVVQVQDIMNMEDTIAQLPDRLWTCVGPEAGVWEGGDAPSLQLL